MNKLEKIEQEAQKAREKIAAMQALLKQIDSQRTEQENLQIIQQVRALKLSRDELYAFLNGGELPAPLADAITAPVEPETIYSRKRKKQNTESDGDTETTTDFESEDIHNEEQ